MNNRGILPGEVMKIVLAVVGLLILMYLAVSIYGVFTTRTAQEQARNTLNQIANTIDSLEEGEEEGYLLFSPNGWALMAINNNFCICSPLDRGISSLWKGYVDQQEFESNCVTTGFCREGANIKIDSFCNFEVSNINQIENCMIIQGAKALQFTKQGEDFLLSLGSQDYSQNILNELLEYKGDSDKTINELLQDYANTREEEGFFRTRANRQKEEQIEELVEDFFENKQITWVFEFWKAEISDQGTITTTKGIIQIYSNILYDEIEPSYQKSFTGTTGDYVVILGAMEDEQ